MNQIPDFLRPAWRRFRYDWPLGLALILLFGVPRFWLVLRANVTEQYNLVSIIFVLMMITPFILLTRFGRISIGMVRPAKPNWLLYGFAGGVVAAVLVYFLGDVLFGDSMQNWYVYISRAYSTPGDLDTHLMFGIMALITMTFSPIGEELLYRGVVHGAFKRRFGENNASKIDSLAFALTHLAHFGVVYVAGSWQLFPAPAVMWVVMMFIVSRFFFLCKLMSGSLWASVVAHAGFNLGMTYCIWYWVLGN